MSYSYRGNDTFGGVICREGLQRNEGWLLTVRAQGAREKLSKSRNTGRFLRMEERFQLHYKH